METPFYGVSRLTAELKCYPHREIINGCAGLIRVRISISRNHI